MGGEVVRCDRAEGTATLHASTLLHAVTRVQVRRTCHTRLCEEALFTEKHNPRPATQALFTPRSCHAVARVQGPAARYSLILFYRQICPAAAHRLVECSVATMDLLYPPEDARHQVGGDGTGNTGKAVGVMVSVGACLFAMTYYGYVDWDYFHVPSELKSTGKFMLGGKLDAEMTAIRGESNQGAGGTGGMANPGVPYPPGVSQ